MTESIARPLGVHVANPPMVVRRIAVVGPGFIGMPIAALLAYARIRIGSEDPAHVVVVQRGPGTLGWQTDAINGGRSPIGGIEPGLDSIIRTVVADGLLTATDDITVLRDADVILVCVPSDLAPDIFSPWVTTKPQGKGSGLGLSITRQVVVTHGGTIRADNRLGRGAVFTIELPAVTGHPEHAENSRR